MNEELKSGFRLNNWEIWPLRDLLSGPDGEHHIEPKAMQVLVALASQPEQVVTREALLDEIWPDTYSGEVSLTRCISQLRRCFSDERGDTKFIETIPKVGYRLVAQVKPFADEKPHDQPKPNTWVAVAIAVLFLAFGYLAFDRLVLDTARHTVTVKAVMPSENSIAVLPFVNVSDDPGNEFFSDGISEEILNVLAQVPELRVTSRSSAFSFKGQNLDVPTMAAQLNVAHVLEGSVRKFGNQLRISAQLIEVETDTNLWSESYDAELKNVLAIQDEIAAAVVDALKIRLLDNVPKVAETSPEAYALYLQARHLMNQFNAGSLRQAETLVKQSLEIDPGFAPAWTVLGNVYHSARIFDIRPLDESIELARDAIQKALAIDPQFGPAYAALAGIEMSYDRDFTAAKEHMQRALALNPGDAAVLQSAARLSSTLGHLDEAIELHRRSVSLDPVSYLEHNNLGLMYYYAHRLDEAADALQMAQSLNPNGVFTHHVLGRALLAQGDAQAALKEMERETADYLRLQGMALAQHALGDTGASDAALQALIECCALGAASQIAGVYAFRGEIDHAFSWLEQAYDRRDGGLTYVLLNPLFTNLHDDPRWEPFLDRMGLPH